MDTELPGGLHFKYYDGLTWQNMGLKHFSLPPHANTFVGMHVGASNTTGFHNTGTGFSALNANTIGSQNTAIGHLALESNTTGILNTATGLVALNSNTTGSENTATGAGALSDNTTGSGNTAIGRTALLTNTTGISNTAAGRAALRYNTTGNGNTAIGWAALVSNTTGNDNTAIGRYALDFNTTGDYNSAVGYRALFSNTIGTHNTAIGYKAFFNDSTYVNSTAVGYHAQPTGSNQIRLGNNAITQIGGYTNWSNVSDARFKKQIQNDVPGLAFISQLKPVTYQMDMDAIAKFHQTPDSLRLNQSEKRKATIRYTGFLAQDVEKVAASIGYNFSGIDKPQHEKDNYSLRYAEFVVPLVKAVQELSEEKATLNSRLEKLEAQLQSSIEN